MAIPVVASVGAAAAGIGTSFSTNAPSGVSTGDMLILSVGTSVATSITTPTGWTLIDAVSEGFGTCRQALYYRVADGTSDDTPTVSITSPNDYCAFIVRITGAASSPVDVKATGSGTASTTPTLPSVTTLVANDLALCSMTLNSGSLTGNPSNWTQQADSTFGGADMRIWTQDAASTGSYGGENAASTSGNYAVVTVALKSSGAGTFSRSFSENLACTETPLRSCTNLRTGSENFGIKEGLFYKPKYRTFDHENLALRDTPTVIPAWGRGVSESFGFRDPTVTRTTQYARALSEQLGMRETINRQATLLRVVSELLALRDTIADIQTIGPGGTTWHRTLAENLAMLDSMTRTTQYQRSIIDSLAMTESILRRADCKRALSENMAFQEQINRATVALRSIAESLGMSESALLHLVSQTSGATSRRFYRPGALDYEWERPARVDQASEHRGTSDEQVQ